MRNRWIHPNNHFSGNLDTLDHRLNVPFNNFLSHITTVSSYITLFLGRFLLNSLPVLCVCILSSVADNCPIRISSGERINYL